MSYNASYKYIPRDAGFCQFCVAVSLCINHSKQKKTTFIFFVFVSLFMILSVPNCFHIIVNQFANAPKTCHNMISQRRTSPSTKKIGSHNDTTQLLLLMCFFFRIRFCSLNESKPITESPILLCPNLCFFVSADFFGLMEALITGNN